MSRISDLETQKKILEEDKKLNRLNRRYKIQMTCLILFILCVLIYAYIRVYVYSDKGLTINTHCQNVNQKDPNHIYEMINISDDASCNVKYNIDYHGNGKVLFNIDVYGNKSFIFNRVNQKDKNGNCLINCDLDDDGFPDYNIDLNGDGIIDLNNGGKEGCKDNCDKNFDMVVDSSEYKIDKATIALLNFDINYDGVCDLNCDTNNDYIADFNIDTDNDRLPDKSIDYNNDGICDYFCEEALNIKEEDVKRIVIDDKKNSSGIDINLAEVEPRSEAVYNIVVVNNSKNAIKYDIDWKNVVTDYNESQNLNYSIERNNIVFVDSVLLPLEDTNIESDILSPSSSVKYTLRIPTNYYSASFEFNSKLYFKITK